MNSNHATLRYFVNTSWLLNNSFLMCVVVVVTIRMAKCVGSDGIGVFNYSFSVVSLFAVVSSLGLDKLVGKQLLNEP
jgi:O-antigen/teichoic acid export membrane protein